MARPGQRAVRLGAILPPLVFIAVLGYWRFLGSDSFRVLVERLLGSALSAEVRIGSHAVEGPARILLRDLSIEFRSDDGPSGVRFTAKTARARAGSMSASRFDTAIALLGDAVIQRPGKRTAINYHLDGSKVPEDVLNCLPEDVRVNINGYTQPLLVELPETLE